MLTNPQHTMLSSSDGAIGSRVTESDLQVRLATTPADVHAAMRLRYKVFVTELGGNGALVDHALEREADQFDAHADHLLLEDARRPVDDQVIGTYRMLSRKQAQAAGGFYSAAEYDLQPLVESERCILELGRSCLHTDYRGSAALFALWQGLAAHIADEGIDLLFGVASFHGTDTTSLAPPLSLLHHKYLAPEGLRVTSHSGEATALDLLPLADLDQRAALAAVPSLIKSYLRLGALIGEGAFIDRAFNTTDVCLILDLKTMSHRQATLFNQRRSG